MRWLQVSKYTAQSEAQRHFDDSLHNFVALLPDDSQTAQLLSPVDYSSGESMLRDLATRTRFFSLVFSVWEDLHVALGPGSNVIERIRQQSLENPNEAIRKYDKMRSFTNRFTQHLFPWTMAYFSDHVALHQSFGAGGRGIVMTVGGSQALYALTTINTFRELGCDLPIELFYLGDQDLPESSRSALANITGVTTRDLSQMVYDNGWSLHGMVLEVLESMSANRGDLGWAAKPMAMLLSSFREVILIDADVFFFDDPARLFLQPDYLRTGAMFFRDRLLKDSPVIRRDFLQQSLPLPISPGVIDSNRWWLGTSEHMQESGVVIVDKWRHFAALLLTTRLNGPERDPKPGKVGVYQMMHGDKETFWLSWEMAGDHDYAFYQGQAGQIGSLTFKKDDPHTGNDAQICGVQLLHLSQDGRPLWFNGWLTIDKSAENWSNFQDFRGFIAEPFENANMNSSGWNGWSEREGGVVKCLDGSGPGYESLSSSEQETIAMILRTAREFIKPSPGTVD